MIFPEYADYDGLGLAGLLRRGEVSPREVLEAAIERSERLNPRLNALVHEDFERARSSLAGLPDGPFRGVPFLVKDLGCPVAVVAQETQARFERAEKQYPLAEFQPVAALQVAVVQGGAETQSQQIAALRKNVPGQEAAVQLIRRVAVGLGGDADERQDPYAIRSRPARLPAWPHVAVSVVD